MIFFIFRIVNIHFKPYFVTNMNAIQIYFIVSMVKFNAHETKSIRDCQNTTK